MIDQLQDLFNKYDSLAPSTGDEGSNSSMREGFDESRNTTGSSHDSESDGYSDNVPDTTVKNLTAEADKIGFMEKKQKGDGLFAFGWKKMYCVVHKEIFYFFKKPGDKKQQGAFSLSGYCVQEAPQNVKDAAKKDCSFELVCPGKKTYQFCADSPEDLQSWKEAINKSEKESEDLEDEELYEPLDEPSPAREVPPAISEPDTNPPKPEPIIPIETENDEEDDDLIYEAVESEAQPAKPVLPPQKSAPTIPLPPVPSTPEGELPPLPAREKGEINPPALPKRNPLPPPPPSSEPEKKKCPSLGKLVHPSEDFENMFYGLFPCKGSTENELSFEPGEIIHVINRDLDSEDWWIGELAGKIGLVPKTYLHAAYQIEL